MSKCPPKPSLMILCNVEKAKNPENIISNLNPYFVKSSGVFQMLQINFGNSVNFLNDL